MKPSPFNKLLSKKYKKRLEKMEKKHNVGLNISGNFGSRCLVQFPNFSDMKGRKIGVVKLKRKESGEKFKGFDFLPLNISNNSLLLPITEYSEEEIKKGIDSAKKHLKIN